MVRALASHQCGVGSISERCHVWVEFVVGSRLTPKIFFGFSGFSPSTKTNISKFQFDQDRRPATLRLIWLLLFVCELAGFLSSPPRSLCSLKPSLTSSSASFTRQLFSVGAGSLFVRRLSSLNIVIYFFFCNSHLVKYSHFVSYL